MENKVNSANNLETFVRMYLIIVSRVEVSVKFYIQNLLSKIIYAE
ncbi:hypothetical protein BH20BAC1_BH20BAC1_12690 [soil metagenome]